MKAKVKFGLVFLLVLIGISACEHQPKLPIKPGDLGGGIDTSGSGGGKCSPDTVYFVNEILPLIRSNCAQSGCHDAATRREGVQLDNYTNIMNTGDIVPGKPGSGDFVKVISSTDPTKRMPPNGNLSQDLIDKIKLWIAQGAKNNYCNSGCDSTKYTYAADIAKMINTNCVACHSSGNVLLNAYNGVKTVADNGRLMGALKHQGGYQPMPNATTSLSACELNKFKKWIDNGAPNN